MTILKVDANDSQARFRQKINANALLLLAAIADKVTGNTAITGATKTKITYDTKGLVTSGADATTADIADSSDKRYVTDANNTKLSATAVYITKEGTSGNWYYKKYSNGTCECWGTYTDASYAMTSAYATGGFYGPQLTATFPFTFAATPRINISTVCPNMGFGLLAAPTTTYTYYRAVNRTSATGTIVSYFHIFGTLA